MLLGPPKSRAGRRVVGIPDVIIPALREHLAAFAGAEPGALVFPRRQGRPAAAQQLQQDVRLAARGAVDRRPQACIFMTCGIPVTSSRRHSGAALKDLMARMGHDSERAALIYQHEARGADKRITDAIDTHVQAEQATQDDDGDGPAGRPGPRRLMAR